MQQKVIQVGNSVGVVIPSVIRKQNGLRPGSKVTVKQISAGILIAPSKKQLAGNVDAKFAKIVDEFITQHEDVLKELANR